MEKDTDVYIPMGAGIEFALSNNKVSQSTLHNSTTDHSNSQVPALSSLITIHNCLYERVLQSLKVGRIACENAF